MWKKGFTLIELITTFALSAVIIVILINIIVVIRNIYSNNDLKSQLYINQSILSNMMNKKINHDNLNSYRTCDDATFCYEFDFYDETTDKLIIADNKISFGDYVYKLPEKTFIQTPSVSIETKTVSSAEKNNSFLIIKIPISNEFYPNVDFGINLIYPYNSTRTSL